MIVQNSVATLYLIRHGHTQWNESGRYQGISDVPLSPAGRRAVAQTAAGLRGKSIRAMYASDLLRARETAEIIARELFPQGIEIKYCRDLREINFGYWEGLTYEQINRRWGSQINQWLADPASVTPPGGESLRDFQNRVLNRLRNIALNHVGEVVAVVAHGGVIAVAHAWTSDVDYRRMERLPVDPAGWLKIQIDTKDFPPPPLP